MSRNRSSMSSGYFSWAFYALLVSVRFSFVIFHSPGYLHPDEFFQSIELAAHDIYTNACTFLTWEFQSSGHGPVRSRSSIYPLAHLPIKAASRLLPNVHTSHLSGNDFVDRLLLPTRLATSFLSFIPDFFIFYLSRNLESKEHQKVPLALLLYSSMAYGGLLWNTRTLSNIWESAAVSAFCYFSLRCSIFTLILQAFIAGWAIFLRPTFPIFVFPFIVFQLFNMVRSTKRLLNLFVYIPLGLLTAGGVVTLLAYLDTRYYTKLNLITSSDLVVTPARFFIYNSAEETLSEHGLHPWYHYMLVHWPLILSPLLAPLAIFPPSCKGSNDGLRYAIWFSVIFSTLILSMVGHKETRFLLPSLPFAITLGALRARRLKQLLVIWVIYQAVLVGFWGFTHQAGLLTFMRSIPSSDAENVSLNIFFRTYMPPRFAFGEPASSLHNVPLECRKRFSFDQSKQCTRVVDFAGNSEAKLLAFLDCLKTYSPSNMVVRVILPGAVLPLQTSLGEYGSILSVDTFFPHLSTESPPLLNITGCYNSIKPLQCFWKQLRTQLSLHSYKLALT